MQKLVSFATLAGLVLAGWFYVNDFQFEGLDGFRAGSADEQDVGHSHQRPLPPADEQGRTIRIATFNIRDFGPEKAANPQVLGTLVGIVRHFDVVAIQQIRSKDQTLIPRFVDVVNGGSDAARPRHYRHVLGPRLGRAASDQQQYAFIYNAATVEVDPHSVYTVADSEDLLHWEPLVAQFRARGPDAKEAFTFILVNVRTDPAKASMEVDTLADVYRAVRQASGGEDDVILLGDFQVPGEVPLEREDLGRLGQVPGIEAALLDQPTSTRRDKLFDNLVYHAPSTLEYTGRSGVLNVMRRFNLTRDEEAEISDRLPVWGEFSRLEHGAGSGPMARQPQETAPR